MTFNMIGLVATGVLSMESRRRWPRPCKMTLLWMRVILKTLKKKTTTQRMIMTPRIWISMGLHFLKKSQVVYTSLPITQ